MNKVLKKRHVDWMNWWITRMHLVIEDNASWRDNAALLKSYVCFRLLNDCEAMSNERHQDGMAALKL